MKRKESIVFYLTHIVLRITCTTIQNSIGLKSVYMDKHPQEPFYIVYTFNVSAHESK